jgi:hypothetical protein
MRALGILIMAAALTLATAACDKTGETGASVKAENAAPSTTVEPATTTTTEAPTTTTVEPVTTTTTAAPAPPPPTTSTTARKAAARPATTTTTAKPPAQSKQCHPSYKGTCIPPDVSDADCAGGSGNGPWYVYEKDISVVGSDVFGLDADHDGIGCES